MNSSFLSGVGDDAAVLAEYIATNGSFPSAAALATVPTRFLIAPNVSMVRGGLRGLLLAQKIDIPSSSGDVRCWGKADMADLGVHTWNWRSDADGRQQDFTR
jgi:hypothetical protein